MKPYLRFSLVWLAVGLLVAALVKWPLLVWLPFMAVDWFFCPNGSAMSTDCGTMSEADAEFRAVIVMGLLLVLMLFKIWKWSKEWKK